MIASALHVSCSATLQWKKMALVRFAAAVPGHRPLTCSQGRTRPWRVCWNHPTRGAMLLWRPGSLPGYRADWALRSPPSTKEGCLTRRKKQRLVRRKQQRGTRCNLVHQLRLRVSMPWSRMQVPTLPLIRESSVVDGAACTLVVVAWEPR